MGLSHQELVSLTERFEQLGLDELVLSLGGTRVELSSSGKPPVLAAGGQAAAAIHNVLAPSVGIAHPRVAAGSVVSAEDTVCVLEVWNTAMEAKAGVKGTVRELQVSEGTLVEYGQLLVSIKPA